MTLLFRFFLFTILFGCFKLAYSEVKLPALISDHMVLQQNSEVTLWGWASSSEEITVKTSWSGAVAQSIANSKGEWKLTIQTSQASNGQTLTISGTNTITIQDVSIGEVWVCGGQSNMTWPVGNLGTARAKEGLSKADYPEIRFFTVGHHFVTTPTNQFSGEWKVCTPETAAKFSATGFYFGKNLFEGIQQPLGLISSNSGGTPAKAWMSKEALEAFGGHEEELAFASNYKEDKEAIAKENQKLQANWHSKINALDNGNDQRFPTVKYNDSQWDDMILLSTWNGTPLQNLDGIVWFRKQFTLTKGQSKEDLLLHLGAIDDADKVWINGVEIGSTEGWNVKRVYKIRQGVLKKGKNQLAVRIIDFAGDGGFKEKPEELKISKVGSPKEQIVSLTGTWKYSVSYHGKVPRPVNENGALKKGHATVLFNGMINPITSYTIAGFIWYQGEADQSRAQQYKTLFPALISEWRKQWNNPELPFYYVQLAPYQYNDQALSHVLREAQLMTLATPNTGMAVILDIGKKDNIHPRNKHDVGGRLARWALAKTYKQDIVYSGPLYDSVGLEGNKIRVYFDHAEGGLKIIEGLEGNFKIAGADGLFVNAKVEIDGNTLLVFAEGLTEPKYVRYGWSNWVQGNLFNNENLPASSFRIDDFPIKTAK